MDDITAELHRLRKERGLTQSELARASGVGRATIASAEAGWNGYSMWSASRLAAVYGLRLALVPEEET